MTEPAEIDDPIDRLAELVRDHINSASLGFEAVCGFVPKHELANLRESEVRVVVVPRSERDEILTRGSDQVDRDIDIAVACKLGKGTSDTFDSDQIKEIRRLYVRQIIRRIKRSKLAEFTWIGTVNDPIYDPDSMDEKRTFLSLITVTFRVIE